MAIFLENFQKYFLIMLLGTFCFKNSKMVNFCPKKITDWTPPPHPPKLKMFFGVLCAWGWKKLVPLLNSPFLLSFFPKIKIPNPSYLPTYLSTYLIPALEKISLGPIISSIQRRGRYESVNINPILVYQAGMKSTLY